MSTVGSDTNPGTEAEPLLTITHACQLMTDGGTITVRAGTYAENLENVVPNNTIIQAYTGETVLIQPVANGANFGFLFTGTNGITLKNLIIDGINVLSSCVKITTGATNILLDGCELMNSPRHGLLISDANKTKWITVQNSKIHDNGVGGLDHGIYSAGSFGIIIRKNDIYANAGHGIHLYGDTTTAEIYQNYIHDNLETGIGLYTDGLVNIYNNVIRRNVLTGLRFCYGAKFIRAYNNTITDSGFSGIELSGLSSPYLTAKIYNNVVLAGARGIFVELGLPAIPDASIEIYNNVATDTSVADIFNYPADESKITKQDNQIGAGFTPLSDDTAAAIKPTVGNPAIAAAVVVSSVSIDYGSFARPVAPSIGAWEPA